MTERKEQAANQQPPPAPVEVTMRPLDGAGNGVFQVIVKVDDQRPGLTIVRTSPRRFAFQSE